MQVSLSQPKKVITRPEASKTFQNSIEILQIIDVPNDQMVGVLLEEIGFIKLDALSGDNYDNPTEWTNADVISAVSDWVDANLTS